ncbi:electron transfer flavoprotein subunit beta/FixA family protein [Pseudarthrobacter oxydans]|uniref:electron transfer flavoprotein subunit beta/FixA family protein n=1 Tax=Pseudarthrobacter oxydans TaxID=1671 RepID=UPI002AA86590|nr:electron transfer flavoprotein subunit beta/FixA family protein [Pseudarthrobacter oxydans]WPU09517.1 electron transfer flavoprotein subunit beta/FixA family protein [Pseudarthrobacter oxydans]
MKIVVLVKAVPDTYGVRKLDLETGLADRAAAETLQDEISERALEVALSYAEKNSGADVTVICMGPESAAASLRKGLAMGANSALQVVDDSLSGADLGLTASVLAAAVLRTGFDLVVTGNQSTDGSAGVIPAMVAEKLGVPQLTALTSVQIGVGTVSGTRASDTGVASVEAELPAVISVTEALPDARFPNFKGIRGASKKPFETLSLRDLGVEAVPESHLPRSIMIAIGEKPPRGAGTKIFDEGDAGAKLAEFLVQNQLA